MAYFRISNGDGDTYVQKMTKEKLEEYLNENEFSGDFLRSVDNPDTNMWCGKSLIIKGEIVVPKAVKTVTKMEID